MYKILFLHGFFASGQCVPAVALRDAFKGRAEVITPDLPIHPKEAISFIRELIETEMTKTETTTLTWTLTGIKTYPQE